MAVCDIQLKFHQDGIDASRAIASVALSACGVLVMMLVTVLLIALSPNYCSATDMPLFV
jgi:hypothetical protein